MKLKLDKPYLSLLPFEIDLPQFCLVTGLNGSGKSQLLSGIQDGAIKCDALEYPILGHRQPFTGPDREVARFSATDFAVSTDGALYEQFSNVTMRETAARAIGRLYADLREEWQAWGKSRGYSFETLKQTTQTAFQQQPPYRPAIPQSQVIDELKDLLASLKQKAPPYRAATFSSRPTNVEDGMIALLEEKTKLPHYLLSEAEVSKAFIEPTPFFNSSLVTLFSRYRARQIHNWISDAQRRSGEEAEQPLTSSEFLNRFGPPPWEVINSSLQRLGLDVRIEPPKGTDTEPYYPQMKTPDGATFPPEQLSSGERVILNLALCGYQTDNAKEAIIPPKIVLLDEVDTPLHPAMAKTFLEVIDAVLLKQFGAFVVATTHSPSTAALFHGETIYVMKKGVPGPQPIAKSKAIADLTTGVPTLSVSVDERRQVFAESPIEAENLDKLYRILRPILESPLSLEFIATGPKHSNSSRDHVQRIVSALSDAGNKTVLGIVDWDLQNIPSDRIKVLAYQRRYALENIVLDPVVLALAVYRLEPSAALHYGLDPELKFRDVVALDPSVSQRLADAVTLKVLGSKSSITTRCRYLGGLELDIDQAYLHRAAHQLEAEVASAFPIFENRVKGGSGKLTKYMIDMVLAEVPEAIPSELLESFEALLQAT
ncbi:MAG: AAA family ATPase [Pseudorhizobium pelagicum]|uniref:AAA family ATPase n=1 Tax=Pseudorhizobium pelagicum TaxID=1509405 RepID=UPI0034606DBF